MFFPETYAIFKVYTDGRRPRLMQRGVLLDYAQWWCSTKEGYTYARD